jgi:hypothetical protein
MGAIPSASACVRQCTDDGKAPVQHRPTMKSRKRPRNLHCLLCHGRMLRVVRRPLDRLISLFVPVQRYRCASMGCGWECRVRPRQASAPTAAGAAPAAAYVPRQLLDASRRAVGDA